MAKKYFVLFFLALITASLPLCVSAGGYTIKSFTFDIEPLDSECLAPSFSGTDISTESDAQCSIRILKKVRSLLDAVPVCAKGMMPSEDCKTMLTQLQSLAPVHDQILRSMGTSGDLANHLEELDISSFVGTLTERHQIKLY